MELDLGAAELLYNQQDPDKFERLPYWIAWNQARSFGDNQLWSPLFDKLPWKANQGATLRGLREEPSPIMRQNPFPQALTTMANRDVIEHSEVSEDVVLYHHDFESPIIPFIGNFLDWRDTQLQFAIKDISRQIAYFNDMFIRRYVADVSPYVYVCGHGLVEAPVALTNLAGTATGSKTLAWWASLANGAHPDITGNIGEFNLKESALALGEFQNTICAPPHQGTSEMPGYNDYFGGNYTYLGSGEYYNSLINDDYAQLLKGDDNDSFATKGFRGRFIPGCRYGIEKYPHRLNQTIDGDGNPTVTFPEPELTIAATAGVNQGKRRPNDDYINKANAPLEIHYLIGASAAKTINVGPPPKEFSGNSISKEKFNGMNWNGKPGITRDILLDDGSGNHNTNKYGRFCQIISTASMGVLPTETYHVLPVIGLRRPLAR